MRDTFPVLHVWNELNVQHLEVLWITLRPAKLPRDFTNITIALVYHPPGANDKEMSDYLIESVDHIRRKYPNSAFYICGDFNRMKTNLKAACNMKQIVCHPTRHKATLDLCYTNFPSFYSEPLHFSPIGLSDHQVLILKPTMSNFCPPKKVTIQRRVKGHNEKTLFLHDLKRVRWQELYRMKSCEDQLNFFYNTMNGLIEQHFPIKIVSKSSNDRPWITSQFKDLIKIRDGHFYDGNDALYKVYRNKVNRERKTLQRKYCCSGKEAVSYESCGLIILKARFWIDLRLSHCML